MLTQVRLKELFSCDVETGKFTWKVVAAQRIKVGDEAGTRRTDGYTRICIDGNYYLRHRLIWLWVHGEWPKYGIDHLLGKGAGDGIDNLRDRSTRENQQNRTKHRDGHLVGTSFYKRSGRWCSRIKINGKTTHLGYFPTALEAHVHYFIALQNLRETGIVKVL